MSRKKKMRTKTRAKYKGSKKRELGRVVYCVVRRIGTLVTVLSGSEGEAKGCVWGGGYSGERKIGSGRASKQARAEHCGSFVLENVVSDGG